MKIGELLKKLYFWGAGYSYTHLGRLFLRLFIGFMLLQFGVRQIMDFQDQSEVFPAVLGTSSYASLVLMICIEIICSVFIMAGFLTRLMIIPPFVAMIFAEVHILNTLATLGEPSYMLQWDQNGYLPIMFLGIYFFLMLVGPGKISVDYFLSLYIIHSDNKSEKELEEV